MSMIFLEDFYGISEGMLWEFNGILMGWYFHGITMDSWRNSMRFLWDFCEIPMTVPWYFYDISMIFLWYFYGITMGCQLKVSWNQLKINSN